MKLGKLKNNVEAEAGGVWVPYAKGVELKLARIGTPAYEAYLRKISKPHTRQLRDGSLDNEVAEELTQKALARHILLGWKGIEDDDGKPLVYSELKAFEVLSDPEYRDFYRDVLQMAQERATFAKQDEEDGAKN